MQLQSFAGADYVERGSGGRGDELIVRRWMADRDGCVLARTPPAARFRDTLTLGWLDAVVDAPSGALVALRSGGLDGRVSWERSKPAVDQSGALAGAWCGRSEHCGAGRVRLTYRMTTRALHLTNESFDVLRGGAGRGRPDVFVYESGAWDLAVYGTYAKKDPQRAAKLISWPVLGATQLRVLENLARAAAATQLPRPRLIYATMPVAFSPLDACADGSWERRVLAALRDRLGNDLEPPQLLNRVAARTALPWVCLRVRAWVSSRTTTRLTSLIFGTSSASRICSRRSALPACAHPSPSAQEASVRAAVPKPSLCTCYSRAVPRTGQCSAGWRRATWSGRRRLR